jgi:hypothetical protein
MGEAKRKAVMKSKRAEIATAVAGASTAQVGDTHRFVIASLDKIGRGEPGALAVFFEAAGGGGGEAFGRGRALEGALESLSDQMRNPSAPPEVLVAARAGAVRVAESAVAFLVRSCLLPIQERLDVVEHILASAGIARALIGYEARLRPLAALCAESRDFLTRLNHSLDELERAAPPPQET